MKESTKLHRRNYRKATISDVAARAGVSITTVSVFVRGREEVCSPETAERIRDAVRALHYTPSVHNSGRHSFQTRVLGVSVTNPFEDRENVFQDQVWRGINHEADAVDYCVMNYPTSVRDSSEYLPFLDGRIDGLILSATYGDPRPAGLLAAGLPLVLLTRSRDLPEECGAVYADEDQVVDMALSHLWGLGHRRIAHLAGPVETTPRSASEMPPGSSFGWSMLDVSDIALWRRDAFVSWMKAHGEPDPLWAASGPAWGAGRVAETLASWQRLPKPPTAIFCANDVIALEALRTAAHLGWRVPQQLSVVGVDDSREAALSVPPLTSVEVRASEIGREAVRTLLRLLEGVPAAECRVQVPLARLVLWASTGTSPE